MSNPVLLYLTIFLVYGILINLSWFIAVNILKKPLPDNSGWQEAVKAFNSWKKGEEDFSFMIGEVLVEGAKYFLKLSASFWMLFFSLIFICLIILYFCLSIFNVEITVG